MTVDTTNLQEILAATREIIPRECIEPRISDLRTSFRRFVHDNNTPVTALVLGKGGHMFAQRLFYGIDAMFDVEYMYTSAYGSGEHAGEFQVRFETTDSHAGRRVVIVDDIWDTGTTPHNVQALCMNRGAHSVSGLFLLSKPSRRKYPDLSTIDVGFEIEDFFAYGYGMDAYGFDQLRRLTAVCCLNTEKVSTKPFRIPKDVTFYSR